jgi:hypothetical protein
VEVSRAYRRVSDLADVPAAASGKSAIAAQGAMRKRTGHSEPATTVVAAAKMPAAVMPPAKMRVATTAVATTVPATMTSTVASTMTTAATFADRSTRKHHRQNDDCNSDGPFGHGSLLRPLKLRHR